MIDRLYRWATTAAFVGLLVALLVTAVGVAFSVRELMLGGFLALCACWLVALGLPYVRARHASEELRSEDWDWPNRRAA